MMLAHGNGNPQVCVVNLLRTIRGEVPYSRTKGLAREHIDAPATTSADLLADAAWVIETFEPRIAAEDVDLLAEKAIEGSFELRAEIR